MKRLNLTFKTLTVMIVCALFTMIATSCRDEAVYDENGNVIEGLPATVSLQLDISGLDAQTRALIDDAGANFCQNIWVGVYRDGGDDDGKCIYRNLFDISETSEVIGKKYPLQFTVPSGKARIVAVTNVNAVEAVASPDADLSTATALGTLLNGDAAKTWEDFKKITALRSSTDDIYQMTYTLPMSGYYSKDDDDVDKMGDDIPVVTLTEGTNDLTGENAGAIHLRRLIAYNKFNIYAGKGINLELVSWQVCNNPYYSYVLNNSSNAGDEVSGKAFNSSLVSTTFETQFDADNNVSGHSFEFYQFENKRDALPNSITETTNEECYNQREAEYKNSDGSNSGAYKCLVGSNDPTDKNNNASYVILKAKLSYYYTKGEDPTQANPQAEKGDNTVARTAEATYVIHLGYCEGNTLADKASDFNCRRNTRYTYNVYIKNVNNIVVEASEDSGKKSDLEKQPGMEGTVYDTDEAFYELDSHYNVFNIALTNADRTSMTYYITAPYNGTKTYISTEDITNGTYPQTGPFYTWIKFRPTSDKDVLAKYADTAKDLTVDNLWSLEDLRDVAGHPGNNGSKDATENATEQYYTVFIDEYVYHLDDDGSGAETSWQKYTNQDDRLVELATLAMRSNDTESQYLKGKYAFSQRSIQTYFDYSTSTTRAAASQTGMGVEHTNESYGLNFCWDTNEKSVSSNNGRYNLQHAVANNTVNYNWDKCVEMKTPEHIVGVEGKDNKQGGLENAIPELNPPVPQLYQMTGYSAQSARPNPNTTSVFSVNTACMNRNRDLNGNGVIDQDEIRWFLPTYNQYVEIMIGRSGLVSPLIDWYEWPNTRYSDVSNTGTEGHQSFYFASSDCGYIEADEGFSRVVISLNSSSTTFIYNTGGYVSQPFEIRCARYLGTNPATASVSGSSDANTAYKKVDGTNKVQSLYFNAECLRPYVSTFLAPHNIASDMNRPYQCFELADNICSNASGTYYTTNQYGYLVPTKNEYNTSYAKTNDIWYQSVSLNELCSKYTQEADQSDLGAWRVPNYAEMAMLFTLGMVGSSYKLPSCTYEYFLQFTDNEYGKCAFFGNKDGKLSRSLFSNGDYAKVVAVRCVRDVK